MKKILFKIFLFTFLFNFLYESVHCLLYQTCLDFSRNRLIVRLLQASFGDAITILTIYLFIYFIFKTKNPFKNKKFILTYSLISITYSYLLELYALKSGMWQYTSSMPLIFGSGLTPTIQIILTGLISFYLIFSF
jgi:hypothetical protein